MKSYAKFFLTLFLPLIFSCERSNDVTQPDKANDFSEGIYICTKGGLSNSNSAIFHLDRRTNKISEIPFKLINGINFNSGLGKIVFDGENFILFNELNPEILLVDPVDFKIKNSYTGFIEPRQVVFSGNETFISDLNNGNPVIRVIRNGESSPYANIPLSSAPGEMEIAGGSIAVASYLTGDTSIMYINPASLNTFKNLNAGSSPANLAVDVNGNLWVLCAGNYRNLSDTTSWNKATISMINSFTYAMEKSFVFDTIAQPSGLGLDRSRGTLFYTYAGNIFSIPIDQDSLSDSPFIDSQRDFNYVETDPGSGDIFAMTKPDASTGYAWIERYDRYGQKVAEFYLGNNPCFIFFR